MHIFLGVLTIQKNSLPYEDENISLPGEIIAIRAFIIYILLAILAITTFMPLSIV